MPAVPRHQWSSGPAVSGPKTPVVQRSSGQRSRHLQPLDASGPEMPAALRCQRPLAASSLTAKCLATLSHERPCPQGWLPLGGSLVRVALWGAESVSSGLSSWSSSLSSLPLCRREQPREGSGLVQNGLLLGSSPVWGATSWSSGLILGGASSWERLRSWSSLICGEASSRAASSRAAFLGVTLSGSSSSPFRQR